MRGTRIRFTLLAATLVAAIFVAVPVLSQDGIWTTKAPMPIPGAEIAGGAVNGVVYLTETYGCSNPPEPATDCRATFAYSPKSDSWSTKAMPPAPSRSAPCAAALDGLFYVIGGSNTAIVQAYDPKSDTWVTKAPLPEARYFCAAGVINGTLYVAGGIGPTVVNGSFVRATLWAYDPKTDTWTAKASMPTPVADAVAGVIGGLFYVAGGSPSSSITDRLQAYDPKTDIWTLRTPMPTPRAFAAGGAVDGRLYVVGGITSATNGVQTSEAYDPKTDSWTEAPPILTGRWLAAAAVADDTVFVIGGRGRLESQYAKLAINEAFTPFLFVGLDIKPGEAGNTINLKSGGVVAAAILGSATFDPLTVDPETVTLAGAHVATRGRGIPMTSTRDVNHDGYPDLVLYFRTQDLQLTRTSTQAVLYGTTYSGQRIRGADAVRIVPAGPASRTPARAQPAAARPRRRG